MAAVAGVRSWRITSRHRRDGTRSSTAPNQKGPLFVGAGRDGVLAARPRGPGNVEIDVRASSTTTRQGRYRRPRHSVLGTADITPRPRERHRAGRHHHLAGQPGRHPQGRRACEKAGVKARIIPGLFDILQGRVGIKAIREVQIEDLLGREPVRLGKGAVRGMLAGRTVMITGAGGSIGSELCRQAMRFSPARLLLVERSEPALYEIDRELRARYQDLPVVPLIADVADRARMQQVFSQWTPDVVVHAAAHKHVPMMELNVGEAIHNTVSASPPSFASTAWRRSSSSPPTKAVNPTSVRARLSACRARRPGLVFEDPLRRVGSATCWQRRQVIPFREQIARGGPVTVTHPDMKRYFMTIPEASQLVLEAGALADGGEVFLLDMGEPVKVLSLAEDMIRLSGLRPYEDVDIHFTGVRPGEKLFESCNSAESADHPPEDLRRPRARPRSSAPPRSPGGPSPGRPPKRNYGAS
jgi:FlaA1/EpsC-like NDP-sugar epimerase